MNIESTNLRKALWNKFISRTDCYAVQNADGSYRAVREKISDKHIQDHLSGMQTIGVYLLNEDSKVKFMALDIDIEKNANANQLKDTIKQVTIGVVKATETLGLNCILEDSGRRGYHVILFFDKAIDAAKAKQLGLIIKRESGAPPKGIGIEVFPKQDSLRGKELGNLLKLPLGIHRKSNIRSRFLNSELFAEAEDPGKLLESVKSASENEVDKILKKYSASASDGHHKAPKASGKNRTDIDRMLNNCPVVSAFMANPSGWSYDAWLGLASNFVLFEGGWERFEEISKQDRANYDQEEIDRIHEEVSSFDHPQGYKKFAEQGVQFETPPRYIRCPADWALNRQELESVIHEEDNKYIKYKRTDGEWHPVTIAEFTIKPKELLELPESDILSCSVTSALGNRFDDILIRSQDWNNKPAIRNAINRSECTFLGSERDVQLICSHVLKSVQVRRRGTEQIGLHDDTWVVKSSNIDCQGYVVPPKIVAFDRSKTSLHNRIKYTNLPEEEYKVLACELFGNILKLNQPEVILPILGWYFAVPLKPRIKELIEAFPILFCYGTMGSGKTSAIKLMQSLQGYSDNAPFVCTMRDFPIKKVLSSTNAVPVFLDEFKPGKMAKQQVDDIHNMLRRVYGGEIEEKGRPDQTLVEYELSAPVVICGESCVQESAVLERVVIAGFTDAVKRTKSMQDAFQAIKKLSLNGFMDRYLMFCLRQDVHVRWQSAARITQSLLNGINVSPRLFNNINTMIFGLEMLKDYAASWGASPKEDLDYSIAVKAQLEEITGDGNGQVKLAADILLEKLSRMAEKGLLNKGDVWTIYTPRSGTSDYLAIHLPSAVDEFKSYAAKNHLDDEILDAQAYIKQFKTLDYVVASNTNVKYSGTFNGSSKQQKSVVIDLVKAQKAGLNLAGFSG